jgi:hypothetical protein
MNKGGKEINKHKDSKIIKFDILHNHYIHTIKKGEKEKYTKEENLGQMHHKEAL